jgi:hypothetical protein
MSRTLALREDTDANEGTQVSPSKTREFAVIRFPGKTKKTDPDLISIGVNGEKIRCKRNEFIPVKAPFIEALRNAKEPVVEGEDFDPSKTMLRRRKVLNFAPRFPFELVGWIDEATYQEFRGRTTSGESLTEKEVYARIG